MDSKVIDIVKRIAEEEGWNVTIDGDTLNFQRYSPAGQDFSFDIEIKDEDTLDDVRKKILDYYYAFDVSYEAYLWLDNTGHGKNGAPNDMLDVYNDMKWCDIEICLLHKEFLDYEHKEIYKD